MKHKQDKKAVDPQKSQLKDNIKQHKKKRQELTNKFGPGMVELASNIKFTNKEIREMLISWVKQGLTKEEMVEKQKQLLDRYQNSMGSSISKYNKRLQRY